MKTHIIQIGNSQGIRIPKVLLQQCGFSNEVELKVRKKSVIISPAFKTRENWGKAFCDMSENKDDKLLDDDSISTSKWDETEWEW
ncbi:AbrB/MazE/SpoVT family DNA-binding domain-containing protein [bacterium]|nr:AbrB/MazE/SpoVT family DNA-binding domain-containing protein [bacterium]